MNLFGKLRSNTDVELKAPDRDLQSAYAFDRRIDAMEGFIRDKGLPNKHFPFVTAWFVVHPDKNSLGENWSCYDAVSVLKGLRPVALLPLCDLGLEDPFSAHLLSSIKQAGFVVQERAETRELIVGHREHVDAVHAVLSGQVDVVRYSPEYHRALGRALGYPEEAIEHFISAAAQGESPLVAKVIELAFPDEDASVLRVRLPDGRHVVVC